ncbi:hypothetical protein EVAR_76472_1 [Eumeta japonica]|uniref:Uncharacterized protein n=1 Tax=Eumeta variegata TaxID=151549 RepID=A0A4C1T4H9_EUMVA|nr:hypothetical protein EVAR_76472_1 [Eumeta japonica]
MSTARVRRNDNVTTVARLTAIMPEVAPGTSHFRRITDQNSGDDEAVPNVNSNSIFSAKRKARPRWVVVCRSAASSSLGCRGERSSFCRICDTEQILKVEP